MANIQALQVEENKALFDDDLRLLMVTYHGVLSSTVTSHIYSWITELLTNVPIETMRGSVFDFRNVVRFHNDNLRTIQKSSQKIVIQVDTSRHPVALLVDNMLQQQMVRISMKITPQEERKRIVKTEQDALAFINNWNAKLGATFDMPSAQLSAWPMEARK